MAHKKRLRIVSKRRFCIFLVSLWLLMCPAVLMAMDQSGNQIEKSFATIYVERGDTLWNIAKKTLPQKTDIRDYIQEIKEANQLQTAHIKEGDVLIVPIR